MVAGYCVAGNAVYYGHIKGRDDMTKRVCLNCSATFIGKRSCKGCGQKFSVRFSRCETTSETAARQAAEAEILETLEGFL